MVLTAPSRPIDRAGRTLARHPGRVLLMLIPVGIAVMVIIDMMLGATAEYYNATHWLQAVGNVITGGAVSDGPAFIMNQDGLGSVAAMLLGMVLLVLEPAAVLAAIVYPASFLARRRLRRAHTGGAQ